MQLVSGKVEFNPKKAGSFDPISQPRGGAPLGSRPRSGEKLCNLAHI